MKTTARLVIAVITVTLFVPIALAEPGSIVVLGQRAKPLSDIRTKVRSVTDRFEEPLPGQKTAEYFYNKISKFLGNFFGAKEEPQEDGFVYVKSVEVLSALPNSAGCALFDVVKDALRQSPDDWETNDYRKTKALFTQQYFRANFAAKNNRRVGKKIFCKKAPVPHLGQRYTKSNRKELKKVLAKHDVPTAGDTNATDYKAFFEQVMKELKSPEKQTSILGVKYSQGYQQTKDGKHWILVYKAEKCKVRELVSYDNEAKDAIALHFVELDPLVKSQFLSAQDVKDACHKLFIVKRGKDEPKMSFEYSYLKKHAKAYKCQHNVQMQRSRFLKTEKVAAEQYSDIN